MVVGQVITGISRFLKVRLCFDGEFHVYLLLNTPLHGTEFGIGLTTGIMMSTRCCATGDPSALKPATSASHRNWNQDTATTPIVEKTSGCKTGHGHDRC